MCMSFKLFSNQRRKTQHRHMRTRSWKKAIYFWLLDFSVSNAHLIYQEAHESCLWKAAKNQLVGEICELVGVLDAPSPNAGLPSLVPQTSSKSPHKICGWRTSCQEDVDRVRLDRSLRHFPNKSSSKLSARTRRCQCAVCTTKTSIFCSSCDTFLCVGKCYRAFHTLVKYRSK